MKNFNNPSTSIKNWAADDRPREKLVTQGASALSAAELLAILLNNGHKEKSAVELARDVLHLSHNNLMELGKLSLKDLQQIKGIGEAKAVSIAASLELGRRRQMGGPLDKAVIKTSRDIADYLRGRLADYSYEVFAVIFLNRASKVNHFEIISRGGITNTIADPKVILKKALEEEATSLILCHNHPSGNLRPSRADAEITHKIKAAASYLDITVNDHIIVSDAGYFSFADGGML